MDKTIGLRCTPGSDADDYSEGTSASPSSSSNTKSSYTAPSGPSAGERLAGFRDLFFRVFSLGRRLELDAESWEYNEEPHATRRQLILAKHPEIKQLFGYEPMLAFWVILEVAVLLAASVFVSTTDVSWSNFLILAYLGGFLEHSLGSAIHELGHNLCFGHKHIWANRAMGMVANLPIVLPMAIMYRQYYKYDSADTDRLGKMLWIILLPGINVVRYYVKNVKPPVSSELINVAVQVAFDSFLWLAVGPRAVGFLFLSMWLGLSINPLSGHFISEHYLFSNAEHIATRSYYGPLNFLMFNEGYHNEHHDFPYVPYSRLPLVKKIASEFYEPLPCHTSWLLVLVEFLFRDGFGPQSHAICSECTTRPELYRGLPTTVEFYERSSVRTTNNQIG